ncbi:MbtH family protein [Streptomyces sp. 12297]|uniref:MbtH family protein n=1 Tax=Streptomyces sp. NBC_00239 TaxID=2903640 RepID=UPI002E2E2371|nr:MbtH family protein [Streptomyces sp. NBC_00239]
MSNPFEDDNAGYLVLVNDENQHSIWPVWLDVPEGWTTTYGEATRQECLDWIEVNWTDIRPVSLLASLGGR